MRFILALLVPLVLWSAAAIAETTVVAVVNGEPITNYDVEQRSRLLKLTGERGNLRDAALEELIDEKVQLKAAETSRIRVTDKDVADALADISKRVKLSPSQLAAALGQQGVSIETLKDRLRSQIAFGRLVRARFRVENLVTEQDLVAALLKDEEREKAIDAALYDLERVAIALPENPSAARMADAKARAAALRQKFTSCSEGLQTAKKTRNVVVQTYGRRLETDLPPEIREALKDVPVGRLSPPVETQRGLEMFAVCDKKMVRSTNAAMKELEPELTSTKGMEYQKQYARQLRRDAVIERR